MYEDVILYRELGRARTNVQQTIVHHSPDGFEWGYYGSGPTDLALNILVQYVDVKLAMLYHEKFRNDFIAKMPREGGIIKSSKILEWLKEVQGK